jgi:hypothetical protein
MRLPSLRNPRAVAAKKQVGQRRLKGGGTAGDNQDHFDPFKRTGRPVGGLINDIRKRAPYYISIGLIIIFVGLIGKKCFKNEEIKKLLKF